MSKVISLVHQGGVSVAELEDGQSLTARQKPTFSFNYDEFNYTEFTKQYTLDGLVSVMTEAEQTEVSAFMETIVEDVEAGESLLTNNEVRAFLAETDWKVLRHIRQKALGQETTLTEEEYLALEAEREAKASLVVELDR